MLFEAQCSDCPAMATVYREEDPVCDECAHARDMANLELHPEEVFD